MLHSAHIRAARALLAWRQQDLATKSKVGLATIQRMEQGEGILQGHVSTVVRLRNALEKAGVSFIEGESVGVELRKKTARS